METNTIAVKTTRTITLTGRPPVSIVNANWPVIAEAAAHNGTEQDATRNAWVKVRQNADGRVIVYGGSESRWQGEPNYRAGVLLPAGADVPPAVRQVAEELGWEDLAQKCIADLPAEELG